MTTKSDELLRRALEDYDNGLSHQRYFEEIRAHLAAEEGKQNIVDELAEALEAILDWENASVVSRASKVKAAKTALAKVRREK